MQIRGLSLTQPWATLMAIGAKRIETRSWSTKYRGLVAIHASQKFPKHTRELCREQPFSDALKKAPGIRIIQGFRHWDPPFYPDWTSLPLGAIIAVGELFDCVSTYRIAENPLLAEMLNRGDERQFGDYRLDRFCFLFQHIIKLPEPIPCKGALGLWQPEPAVAEKLEAIILASKQI